MKKAFSLVELSIVLVILGLLVGGVLSGQSLIRAAELRSVSTDFGKYQAALNSFRDKYFAIPGDFSDATRFWGRLAAIGTCVTNSSAAVTASGVCDGDGNGKVDNYGATGGQSYEMHMAWRELAAAALVEGSYSGVSSSVGTGTARAVNAPASKLDSATLILLLEIKPGAPTFSNTVHYTIDYGNALGMTYGASQGVLTPEEAWNIDTKMDDGKPATGKIMGANWDTCTTSTSTNDFTGTYDFLVKTKECALLMKNAI